MKFYNRTKEIDFLRFWFNYFDRNQTMVEMNSFEHLRHIISSDYPTFSGFALEKWFRLKMMESHQYSDIGSWWERKKVCQCPHHTRTVRILTRKLHNTLVTAMRIVELILSDQPMNITRKLNFSS